MRRSYNSKNFDFIAERPAEERINGLLVELCSDIQELIISNDEDTLIEYFQHLIYQLDTSEPLDLNNEAQTAINRILQSFQTYTQENALSNISRIKTLQEKLKKIIEDFYTHTALQDSLSLLYDNIASLKKTESPNEEGSGLLLKEAEEIILDRVDDYAKALRYLKQGRDNGDLVSKLNKNLSQYIYQVCCETFSKAINNTIIRGDEESPQRFSVLISHYWNILKILAGTNEKAVIQKLAINFLSKAGKVIDHHKKQLRSELCSKQYQFTEEALNELVKQNTALLTKSVTLSLHRHNFSWEERRKELSEIRREAADKPTPLEQQEYLSQRMNILIKGIIKESEGMLGTPPCNYAVLSFGSLSRNEFFPCSDLECLVVLDMQKSTKDPHKAYFTALFKLINAQIIALGENGRGFGLDKSNPITQYNSFVITRDSLKSFYEKERRSKDGVYHSLLKPSLIYNSNENNNILEKYEEIMAQILSSIHKEQAINQFKDHITKFEENLNNISLEADISDQRTNKGINLKNCYYSPLVYLAIDLGLYYNIKSNNTLEIYEELSKKGIISGEFLSALKEAYSYIVELRIEAHNFKQEHYDEVYLPDSNKIGHLILKEAAYEKLKKYYISVLLPLYKAVGLIVNTEGKGNHDTNTATATIDRIARTYYESRAINREGKRISIQEALDDEVILPELLSIYHQHYSWLYCLESITQNTEPTAFPVLKIQSADLGARFIKPEVADKIFDKAGNFKANESLSGTRRVSNIKYGQHRLHVKLYPELPGIEKAAELLGELVVGSGTASLTEFVRCTVTTEGNKQSVYPLLLSQTIPGKTIAESDLSNMELDHRELSKALLAAVITLQEDGHSRNYILEPFNNKYRPVCIDKDHGFIEPIIAKDGVPILMFTSILYCFKEAKELEVHPSVRRDMVRLNIDILLQRWLEELDRIHKYHVGYTKRIGEEILGVWGKEEIEALLPKEKNFLPALFKTNFSGPRCCMSILIGEKALREVSELLWQTRNEPEAEHGHLFILKFLHAMVKKIYDRLFLGEVSNPLDKFSIVAADKLKAFPENTTDPLDMLRRITTGKLKSTAGNKTSKIDQKDSPLSIDQRIRSIAGKLPTLKEIWEQKKLRPQGALEELQLLKYWADLMKAAPEDLKYGSDARIYEQLLPIQRESLINSIDARKYNGGKNILTALEEHKTKFRRLILRGFSNLTDLKLLRIINFSDSLMSLTIIDSEHLMGGCFIKELLIKTLSDYCKLLETLTLEKVSHLISIGQVTHAPFPSLKRITIKDCPKLQTINITAPKLNEFIIENCSGIGMLKVRTNQKLKEAILPHHVNNEVVIVHKNIEQALKSKGYFFDAIQYYQLVQLLKINNINTLIQNGEALEQIGYYETALGHYKYALYQSSIFGMDRLNYIKLGKQVISICIKQKKYDEAQVYFEQILNVFSSLLSKSTTRILDLSEQGFNDQEIRILAKIMEKNTTFTQLNLSRNNIGDEGGKALAEMLEENTTLTKLYLGDNKIENHLIELIDGYLKRNQAAAKKHTENFALAKENINKEVLHGMYTVTNSVVPISQALRAATLQLQPVFAIKTGDNYFSYLPSEVITHILTFIPEAKVLHPESMQTLLEKFIENKVVTRSEQEELLNSPKQISYTQRILQNRMNDSIRESNMSKE